MVHTELGAEEGDQRGGSDTSGVGGGGKVVGERRGGTPHLGAEAVPLDGA